MTPVLGGAETGMHDFGERTLAAAAAAGREHHDMDADDEETGEAHVGSDADEPGSDALALHAGAGTSSAALTASAAPASEKKSSTKRESDEAVTDEVDRPSFVPELSARVIETVLQINTELIRLCVEYQNRGWFQDPDFAIYQTRLQANLSYLASVADYYLKPDKSNMSSPAEVPVNLTPLAVQKSTETSTRLNTMLRTAQTYQEELIRRWNSETQRQSRRAFERLHQAERERAQNTPGTAASGSSAAGSAGAADPRKRKRVQDATQVSRVTDPQAGSGAYGAYQPLPPFMPGAGVPVPSRAPGTPAMPVQATGSTVGVAGVPGGASSASFMLPGQPANAVALTASPALSSPAVAAAVTAAAAATAGSAPVITPQMAQLAAQLGLHPAALAQLTANASAVGQPGVLNVPGVHPMAMGAAGTAGLAQGLMAASSVPGMPGMMSAAATLPPGMAMNAGALGAMDPNLLARTLLANGAAGATAALGAPVGPMMSPRASAASVAAPQQPGAATPTAGVSAPTPGTPAASLVMSPPPAGLAPASAASLAPPSSSTTDTGAALGDVTHDMSPFANLSDLAAAGGLDQATLEAFSPEVLLSALANTQPSFDGAGNAAE
ncbi:hypothetical protein THASP1DRAFT_32417 [Thamnocephalis sphaerospora]|uniref:SS18 N-terminal domain-containing protein n=1 Tax=Thamnocephalis sphaerospora TaxID=78915 RepID=A0A4P9XJ31_9FUNG|nr:hypothetical protein THASP1DRAFT_32417 [Thamnocephalis sphaerospora]|eukprot:RKP05745.1 hypothetical protein THASP1DRAFT_32417 [Thamnocephalis sphaerospora]